MEIYKISPNKSTLYDKNKVVQSLKHFNQNFQKSPSPKKAKQFKGIQ